MNHAAHKRLRCAHLALVLGLVVLPSFRGASADQPHPSQAIEDAARVTAIDVVVSVENRAGRAWLTGNRQSRDLEPSEVTIRFGGKEQTVIGLAMADPNGDSTVEAEPWRTVIWLDAGLAGPHDLHFAATEIGTQAEALAALGTVEIVIADPRPRQALAPTRDAELIGATLGQIALRPPPSENTLVSLRHDFLLTLPQLADLPADEAVSPKDLATAAAAEEQRLVQEHLDAVLLWLTDREGTNTSPRQALFLANGGYDLDPDAFYQAQAASFVDIDSKIEPPPSIQASLAKATESFAQTLAAYGWATISVLAPLPPPPQEGVYLGRWFFPKVRLGRIRGKNAKRVQANPETGTVEEMDVILLPVLAGTYKENLDPEKAAAYIELGVALRAQGKLEDAVEAFEKAVYHYQNDHRTTADQAAAWAQLGATYAELENQEGVRTAFQRAISLDPTLEVTETTAHARLTTPSAPLALLADATAGRLASSAGHLAGAVASLGQRVRVTYQVTGPPLGTLVPLEIDILRPGTQVRGPRWARSATPESLSALRLRNLLAGEVGRGTLDVRNRGEHQPDGKVMVAAHLGAPPPAWAADPDRDTWLRVSIGFGDPQDPSGHTIEHRPPRRLDAAARSTWRHEEPLQWPENSLWLVVVIEDLGSGQWGAGVLAYDDIGR